jgi:hypothetical protein
MRSVLAHAAAGGGVQSLANTVRNAIVLFARIGRSDTAAVLSGWLDAQPIAIPGTATMRAHAADAVQQLATQLGRDELDRARATGATMPIVEIVGLLLAALDAETAAARD